MGAVTEALAVLGVLLAGLVIGFVLGSRYGYRAGINWVLDEIDRQDWPRVFIEAYRTSRYSRPINGASCERNP